MNKSKKTCLKHEDAIEEKKLILERLQKNEEKDKEYITLQEQELEKFKKLFDSTLKTTKRKLNTTNGRLVSYNSNNRDSQTIS